MILHERRESAYVHSLGHLCIPQINQAAVGTPTLLSRKSPWDKRNLLNPSALGVDHLIYPSILAKVASVHESKPHQILVGLWKRQSRKFPHYQIMYFIPRNIYWVYDSQYQTHLGQPQSLLSHQQDCQVPLVERKTGKTDGHNVTSLSSFPRSPYLPCHCLTNILPLPPITQ